MENPRRRIAATGAASVVLFGLLGAGVAQAGAMGAFDQSINNSTVVAGVIGGVTQQQTSDLAGTTPIGPLVTSSPAGTTTTALQDVFSDTGYTDGTKVAYVKYASIAGTGINQKLVLKVRNTQVLDASGTAVTDPAAISAVLQGVSVQINATPTATGITQQSTLSNLEALGGAGVLIRGATPTTPWPLQPGASVVITLTTTVKADNQYQGYSIVGDLIMQATTL